LLLYQNKVDLALKKINELKQGISDSVAQFHYFKKFLTNMPMTFIRTMPIFSRATFMNAN
jgi:hypothetical protein